MSPTPLKNCIGLGNPQALSPMPHRLIQTDIFWSKLATINKQTLIRTNNLESDLIIKWHWPREPTGTVPDASRANPDSYF